MGSVLNGGPNIFDALEPPVGGSLIADAAPDAFLWIQARLIAGQIV